MKRKRLIPSRARMAIGINDEIAYIIGNVTTKLRAVEAWRNQADATDSRIGENAGHSSVNGHHNISESQSPIQSRYKENSQSRHLLWLRATAMPGVRNTTVMIF